MDIQEVLGSPRTSGGAIFDVPEVFTYSNSEIEEINVEEIKNFLTWKAGRMPTGAANRKKTNAYAAVAVDPDTGYSTPGAFELERLFWHGAVSYTHVNEVFPNLYIGDEKTALDRYGLEKSGFTHILNAAHGRWNVDTGAEYYSDMDMEYYGVEATDLPTFSLSPFFYPAAEFIHTALKKSNSKVLVHCAMGRSRSASLVLAYLMIYEKMTVVDAIAQVLKHRCILPNRGFLKQLRQLDIELALEKRAERDADNGFEQGE